MIRYTSKHIINMNFVHYTLESLMLTVYYHILLSNENNVQHPAILNDSLLCQHTKRIQIIKVHIFV